jgi:hypothetical protein
MFFSPRRRRRTYHTELYPIISGVNYGNVYRLVDTHRQERINGITSKRKNAEDRIPKISSEKNKQMIKDTKK